MFEQASRMKLRFDTEMGNLSVEDLWDLPLSTTGRRGICLDEIAIGLHNKLKHDTVSFVDDEKPNPLVQLQFDVVKHVIDVRKQERKEAAAAREKAEQKQKIMAIVARKQDAELEGKSLEELQALIAGL